MTLGQLRRYCGADRRVGLRDLSILAAVFAVSVTPGSAHAQSPSKSGQVWVGESGVASVYSNKYQGRKTALGTRFDQRKLTAAHPWLPLGTKVKVTLVSTGESVIVTITDRLYARHCVIDLSTAAARLLGMRANGLANVALSPT
jgi:rare lipoprotein A (peptidoglycan hydrolase)